MRSAGGVGAAGPRGSPDRVQGASFALGESLESYWGLGDGRQLQVIPEDPSVRSSAGEASAHAQRGGAFPPAGGRGSEGGSESEGLGRRPSSGSSVTDPEEEFCAVPASSASRGAH